MENRDILVTPSSRRRTEFLKAVAQSRTLHGKWASPPCTPDAFDALLKLPKENHMMFWVVTEKNALAGAINISEIVWGKFQSGYLGYYALVPYDGQGYMKRGLRAVITEAFVTYGLHRLEANIQPDNVRSIGLAKSLGFRKEGYSPRYLKIAGRWRDHERWAITKEEWRRIHR